MDKNQLDTDTAGEKPVYQRAAGRLFPAGTPEELYNWPQRQQQYITEQQRISASSGEPCPHGGEWSIFVEDKPVTVTLEQGN